jgi:hypothetical protein
LWQRVQLFAALQIVVQLALCFGCDFVPVNDGNEVGAFEAVWEGLLVVDPAGEIGLVRGLVGGFGRTCFGGIFAVVLEDLTLVSFWQVGLRQIQKVCDRHFHAAKIWWVGAGINRAFNLVKGITIFAFEIRCQQVIADRRTVVKDCRLLCGHLSD